jgi:hypothetical protein
MASKLAAFLIFILFALAVGQGCTSSTGGGGQPGGQSTSGAQGEIYPGPTVTAPPNYAVEIQENRNPNTVHPDITVTFRGGKGQIFIKRILATVVRSDGQVISKEIDQPQNGQISVGDSVTFQGTTGVDRVIVVVTILGKDYKIMDKMDDFNAHL